jgi:hypothetical protein
MKSLKMSITPVEASENLIKEKWISIYEVLFEMTLDRLAIGDKNDIYKKFIKFSRKDRD